MGADFGGALPLTIGVRGWVQTFCIETHFTQKHHMCMTVTSSCKSCSPLPSPSTEKLSFNFKYSSCSNLSCSSFRFRSSSSFSQRNLFNWLNYDSFHTRSYCKYTAVRLHKYYISLLFTVFTIKYKATT